MSGAEDTQQDHDADTQTLKIKVKHLEARAEDAENRDCRNIRIA